MINVLSTLLKTNIEQHSTLRELITQGRFAPHASSSSSSSFNAYLPQESPVQQSTLLNPWSIDQIKPVPIEQTNTIQATQQIPTTQQIQPTPNFQEQKQIQEQQKLRAICKEPIPRVQHLHQEPVVQQHSTQS